MAAPVRLSEFIVAEELGAGSYARVVRAVRRASGEEFALKVMNKAFLLREGKAEAARRERDTLAALRDAPGVLRLAFTFQDASSLYLGTELCAGGDLHAQLARRGGRAAPWEARFWVAQAALALAAVHAARCVHRDVKPENLLLTAAGHVRLCDFGSVRLLDAPPTPRAAGTRRRGAASFAGTAEYMAPELLDGAEATPAADFWALGCVLFQALVRLRPRRRALPCRLLTPLMPRQAGRPPFRGASEYLTYQAVLSHELRHPEDAPPDAVAAVDALLHADPMQRCGAARGLDELRELPFLRDAPWDDIWNAPAPPVLPPPAEEAASAQDEAEARWELTGAQAAPFSVDALRAALPALPPFTLAQGEAVVRAGRAARKRGATREHGRLTLTSLGRLALLPDGGGAPLLELPDARGAGARALDAEHLAIRTPQAGEVFLQLLDGDAADWATQLAVFSLTAQ
jgi:3-phosphoinositide dependent protein kinase-1